MFVLSKNPILFLLPAVGSVTSITTEIIFVTDLYHSNGNKFFFPDNILFVLFLAAFTITYFQLGLSKKAISLASFKNTNTNYSIAILELFIIYSIYSLIVVFVGAYDSQVRGIYDIKSNQFSLYTFKITTYRDIINVIPAGIVIVPSSTLTSFLFSAWMVQYVVGREQDIRCGLIESLRKLVYSIRSKNTKAKLLLLFLITLLASILDFVLTNIAVIHILDTFQLYLYQFVILSVVDSLYTPFFLICLFLVILPIKHP